MEFPDKDNDIHLYIDYNGGPRYVAFMQVVLAQFLKTRNVQLEQIITMTVKAIKKPVTVKIRRGFDESNLNAVEIAKTLPNHASDKELENVLSQIRKSDKYFVYVTDSEWGYDIAILVRQ